MPPVTKNLGLVRAIHVGVNPPVNTKMLWYNQNPGENRHYYYDTVDLIWKPLKSGDIPISDLELGETANTAYRGDRGKQAYDHSLSTGNPHGTTKDDIGLSNVENKSVAEIKDEIIEGLDYKFDQKENVIEEWVDKDYEEYEKSHKYGIIWEAEEDVADSDVPGVSTKWKPITQQIKEKESRNYDKGEIALTPDDEPIVAQRDVTAIENITSTDAFFKIARTDLNTYTFSGTYKK